uniref:DB domain-containing protein n=1 Tax=Syphacia muris TaxID=451379 RepID=A0A0N5AIG7_9BILA
MDSKCFGLGGCGFGGLCCFAPTLACGCMRFCHRVKGSKTLTVDDNSGQLKGRYNTYEEENIFYSSPDEEFYECCKDRGLPESCLEKCTYSTYSSSALRDMFLRTDSCPVRAANDIHLCASRNRDHRQCCYEKGVSNTIAGNKCLLFCQRPPDNQTSLDLSYLPCYDQFDRIRDCFYEDAVHDYRMHSPDPGMMYKKFLSADY